MPTEYWFPTPIYHNMIDNYNEVQKELSLIVDDTIFKKYDDPNWDTNACSFSDGNVGPSLLAKYKPKLFLNELFENVRLFFKDLNSEHMLETHDIVIDESWLARTRKNEYHHKHAHTSELAGVYYVKTNGMDGDIVFHTGTPILGTSKIFRNSSDLAPGRKIESKMGRIILFPGWLEHSVNTNQTNDDRISLSFNISLRKKYV